MSSNATHYARLAPGCFAGLNGFCYVSYGNPEPNEIMVMCSLVPSGIWSATASVAEDVPIEALLGGLVSAEEALSGAATYVG